MASALYRQKSTHLRQNVHFVLSHSGIFTETDCFSVISGLKKRCPLGSSTSQSTYTAFSVTHARLTEIKVLPVPPLPLRTAICIIPCLHDYESLGEYRSKEIILLT